MEGPNWVEGNSLCCEELPVGYHDRNEKETKIIKHMEELFLVV
jgi:hypothetical protein